MDNNEALYTTYKIFNNQKVNSNYHGIKIVNSYFIFRFTLFNDLIWICNLQNKTLQLTNQIKWIVIYKY
jgi:hypothetical protein